MSEGLARVPQTDRTAWVAHGHNPGFTHTRSALDFSSLGSVPTHEVLSKRRVELSGLTVRHFTIPISVPWNRAYPGN